MFESKELHLPKRNREGVLKRQQTSTVLFGIGASREYDPKDLVRIFVGKEPLAEGVIKTVIVRPVSQVIDMVIKKKGGRTRKVVMDALNLYYKDEAGRDLRPRDNMTVLEWEYVEKFDKAI